ncbi:DUF2149 domain-containing protein [Methanogenium cariaci]|uniref:DUF2149 domain-containing protein n=1 Tax=Methanogenium cariaci TaxID=2197 RepID=UPI000B047D76|nr:DUF2149 domain-containing protein [Methanogenium cariaci]
MANLFDVAMVFAVALLVALVLSFNIPEMLDDQSTVTLVKNPRHTRYGDHRQRPE